MMRKTINRVLGVAEKTKFYHVRKITYDMGLEQMKLYSKKRGLQHFVLIRTLDKIDEILMEEIDMYRFTAKPYRDTQIITFSEPVIVERAGFRVMINLTG